MSLAPDRSMESKFDELKKERDEAIGWVKYLVREVKDSDDWKGDLSQAIIKNAEKFIQNAEERGTKNE